MATIRVGCQTYSWEMLGDRWSGSPDHILDAVAGAGYAGVEFAATMIGAYYDAPAAFAEALAQRGLELAAFAYASPHGFTDPAHLAEELAGAERALRFAAEFPRSAERRPRSSHRATTAMAQVHDPNPASARHRVPRRRAS